jgi:anti-sigma factor ChrR (cupin superfamily)
MHTHRFSLPLLHVIADPIIKLVSKEPRSLRPGVMITPLITSGDRIKLALLDYAPGARVPRHRHPRAEIIYMLSGEQTDDYSAYGAGTCVINRAGSSHAIKSPKGCRLIIYWREPVQFVADAI